MNREPLGVLSLLWLVGVAGSTCKILGQQPHSDVFTEAAMQPAFKQSYKAFLTPSTLK